MGGWWRWTLVSPDGVAPSRMISVSASVNLPLHHKVQTFSSGTGSAGWSRKKGRKTIVVVVWWPRVWNYSLPGFIRYSAISTDCFIRVLKRNCLLDTSACALGVLDDNALYKFTYLLTYLLTYFKTAVLTFKIRNTATPAYLSRHIQSRDCVRNLRSSGTPLLARPSWKTDFAARGFRHSAPAVWNSLPKTVLDSSSLTLFKSRLKSHLLYFTWLTTIDNDWHDLTCSATASEVTTLWRYRNECIIIIIIIIISAVTFSRYGVHVHNHVCRMSSGYQELLESVHFWLSYFNKLKLESGPMPNMMDAQPNVRGTLSGMLLIKS